MAILLSATLVTSLALAQPQLDLFDWYRVALLKPGTEVVVQTMDGKRRWRLRDVTNRELIVVARDRSGAEVRIPRAHIQQISCRKRQGSGWGALAGLIAGMNIGFRSGVALGFKQCGSSCSDEGALILLSFIGIPAATAWAGYHITGRTRETVVYRARSAPGY